MKTYEELQKRVKELEAAVEWVTDKLEDGFAPLPRELRARAFPPAEPEFEEVEIIAWKCPVCGKLRDSLAMVTGESHCCVVSNHIELKGIDHRPKKKQVFRREEIKVATGQYQLVNTYEYRAFTGRERIYREWTEDAP